MHYSRWQTHGDPSIVHVQQKVPCEVSGCTTNAHAHGYCPKHLARWKKHGDPLFEAPTLGRPLKGDVLTFGGVHKRLARTHGSASRHLCVDCGAQAKEWSYDGRDGAEQHELVRGSRVAYSLDLTHYQPRCVSCHRKFDHAGDRDRNADGSFATSRAEAPLIESKEIAA
jgi:hypothetical protein